MEQSSDGNGERGSTSSGEYRLVAEPARSSVSSGTTANQARALEKRLTRLTIWLIVLTVVNVGLVIGGLLVWHHYAPLVAAASTQATQGNSSQDPRALPPSSPVSVPSKLPPITAVEYSWWATTGQRIVNRIQADVHTIETDVPVAEDESSLQGYTAVVADCEGLESDATGGRAAMPVPNGTLEASWSMALSDYIQAGRACTEGVNTRSHPPTDQAVSEVLGADKQVYALAVAFGQYAEGR